MDYQAILQAIHHDISMTDYKGKVASYIPELSCIDTNNFGIHLIFLLID